MKTIMKYAAAIAVTSAFALAAATPSEARNHGGAWAAAGAGFAAGAIVGAAAANSYGPGYYGPGYYGPAYYGPAYYGPGPYAYEAAPVYVAPAPAYVGGRCWHSTDSDRGFGYYGACR